ncbi:hypothetical protein Ahy_A09g045642 [Arachis hypogaea]|uniref:PB1-like domain-containing protein n=1 Tax=Arachis hypogaea TaxID=3818 RepID=A0A445BMU0_ARAHY|nr:hypothetical protein Ahy_A09g045642 [Arachis hypogaea]
MFALTIRNACKQRRTTKNVKLHIPPTLRKPYRALIACSSPSITKEEDGLKLLGVVYIPYREQHCIVLVVPRTSKRHRVKRYVESIFDFGLMGIVHARKVAEEMSDFSVKIYHQGRFRLQGGAVRYLGGEISIVDYLSRQEYLKKDIAVMWYKAVNAGLEKGLSMLKTDKDAMDMARIGVKDDMVEVYVVHKTSEVGEDVQPGQITTPAERSDEARLGPIVVYEGPVVGLGSKPATDGPIEKDEIGSMREGSCEDGRGSDAVEEEDEGSETSNDDDYEPRGSESSWSSESIARNASDHSLDFGDSDDDREGTEGLVDVNITEEGQKESIPSYNSEDFLDIPLSEDEEDMGKRFPIHRPLKNMSEYKWEVGTLYVSREEFKDCATAYAVSSGRGLRFSKVDLRRVKVECVEGCEWYAYCGKLKHERSWQLKSCNNKHNKHNCSRELKIGIMHAKWLSKVFLNKIAENPKIKLTTLMRKAYTKWNVELTKSKASRVRQFALDELQGTYIEQYRRKFQLSGIPCAHAMTCIRKMCFNVDTYVSDYYKKAAYISCYQHVVFPINGPNLWDRTQFEDVLPPTYRKPIGRPKKKRTRAADEKSNRTGLSREGQQQKCSYCLCSGHNKRSCPKKRKVTPSPAVDNAGNSASKGRSQRGVRKSVRLSSKTPSSVSSQQSQAAVKRAKVDHSQTAYAPAPTTARVLPTPVKKVSQSTLRFMARTPPRAWKNVE